MRRAVQLLMLVTVVAQATGLLWLASEELCAGECEDDDEGRECPPICPTCACSARPVPSVPVVSATQATLPPATRRVEFIVADATPPTPEPHEILHVPIRALAPSQI